MRLGDIATVTERSSTNDDAIVFDGRPTAILDNNKIRAEDSMRIVDTLNEFLDAERTQAPPNVTMEITTDGASVVRERLSLVIVNGLQGLALVLGVLLLFFGFRFAFWVTMGLPVSSMGGVALMGAVGYSLNLTTTLGLLIVFGLLMDDAIVIAENIARLRESGRSAVDAAVEGAAQVFPNVLASFGTTALIFGSLAFLDGDLGAVLRVVPVVMLFVLSVSLIEAFLILPHHLIHALNAPQEKSRVQPRVETAIRWVRDRLVGPIVDLTIRWRYAVAGLSIAVLLVSVSTIAGGYLKFTAFPELDGDTIVARGLLPLGTPRATTQRIVAGIEDGLKQVNARHATDQPDGAAPIRHSTVFFVVNRDAFAFGQHVVTVSVDLLPSAERTLRPYAIIEEWRSAAGAVPDVISLKYAESTIGPAGIAIDMRLRGDNFDQLEAASLALQEWIWQYEGVTSVLDDLRPGKRELRITLMDKANEMGITAAMVADQLRSAYFGTTISEMKIRGISVEVTAEYRQGDQDRYRAFDGFIIAGKNRANVPLSIIADISIGQGINRINRENGIRTVTVQGAIDTRVANANAIVSDVQRRFIPDLLGRFPDITLDVKGQKNGSRKNPEVHAQGISDWFDWRLLAVEFFVPVLHWTDHRDVGNPTVAFRCNIRAHSDGAELFDAQHAWICCAGLRRRE